MCSGCAVRGGGAAQCLHYCGEARDADQPSASGQRNPLSGGEPDPNTGETARTYRRCDDVELTRRQPGLGHHAVEHGHQHLAVGMPLCLRSRRQDAIATSHCSRAAGAGGLKGE